MSKINVAIIFGGASSEHKISIISAATIINNMSFEKYNIIPVYITQEGKWLLYDGNINNISNINWEIYGTPGFLSPDKSFKSILRISQGKVNYIPIDVCFPVLHGLNGEDGTIQGLFELSGIPYVGCDLISSAMCMDKAITKKVVDTLGIKQAECLVYTQDDLVKIEEKVKITENKIGYPCFIKPSSAGSSIGISKATNISELKNGIEHALQFSKKIIIEKAIIGREVECAILGSGDNDTIASGVGEIIPANDFYDYNAKYENDNSKTIYNAVFDKEVEDEIKQSSLKIFKALGCFGLSRVDFFLEKDTDNIIFNEINTIPGFTSISMYPMLWAEKGIALPELIDKLIELAFKR